MMEVEDDGEDEESKVVEEEGEVAQISVNALAGISSCKPIRVKGMYGKKATFLLIDSRSTHNFIDQGVAEKLGCILSEVGVTKVVVADGTTIDVVAKVEGFKWSYLNVEFEAEVMVIPLGCCDMVLGIQWLETLGSVIWDFKNLEMRFKMGHKQVVLKGIGSGSVRELRVEKVNKLLDQGAQISMIVVKEVNEGAKMMELFAMGKVTDESRSENQLHNDVEQLLHRFEDVFQEPKKLPPFRDGHDHRIHVIEGSNPVNQRSYRYTVHQKNEIDKMRNVTNMNYPTQLQLLCLTCGVGQEERWDVEIVCGL